MTRTGMYLTQDTEELLSHDIGESTQPSAINGRSQSRSRLKPAAECQRALQRSFVLRLTIDRQETLEVAHRVDKFFDDQCSQNILFLSLLLVVYHDIRSEFEKVQHLAEIQYRMLEYNEFSGSSDSIR